MIPTPQSHEIIHVQIPHFYHLRLLGAGIDKSLWPHTINTAREEKAFCVSIIILCRYILQTRGVELFETPAYPHMKRQTERTILFGILRIRTPSGRWEPKRAFSSLKNENVAVVQPLLNANFI